MRETRTGCAAVLLALMFAGGAGRAVSASTAAGVAAAPLVNPEIHAVRMETPPAIDGVVDEPAWEGCPEASGFTHERQAPAQETRVRVGYDAAHLYFAFRCLDPEPGLVRALQTKRNGSMGD